MNGRDKCELLNEIRQKIADENNIEFTIYDCTFEGDCTGTCPKCESELEYLERELEKKQNAGEKINLKNIFTINQDEEEGSIELIEDVDDIDDLDGMPPLEDVLRGEVCPPDEDVDDIGEIEGIIEPEEEVLMGDITPLKDLDEDY